MIRLVQRGGQRLDHACAAAKHSRGCAAIVAPVAPPGSYAVAGAVAVLAAATRGPVSSLVLVLELTRRVDANTVLILLAVCGATITA